MNKKTISSLAVVAVLSCFLCSCGASSTQKIQKEGKFRVAVPSGTQPYIYQTENGDFEGIDAEIARKLAEKLGVEVEFKEYGRDKIIKAVNKKDADIAVGRIADSVALRNECLVSDWYESERVYIVTPRGSFISSTIGMENKNIGVSTKIADDIYNILLGIDEIQLQSEEKYDIICSKINEKAIAGFVCYQQEALELLQYGDFQVQVITDIEAAKYAVLMKKDNYDMLDFVNTSITEWKENNVLNELVENN